jgi:hypothetical protein
VMAFGLSTPAFAQLTADAGSGPTSGAASANDAGSGPTKGAKPITDSSADMKLDGATENSAGATPAQSRPEARSPSRPSRQRRSRNYNRVLGVSPLLQCLLAGPYPLTAGLRDNCAIVRTGICFGAARTDHLLQMSTIGLAIRADRSDVRESR